MNRPFVDPRTGLFMNNNDTEGGGDTGDNSGLSASAFANLAGSMGSNDPTALALQQLLNSAQQQQQAQSFLNPGGMLYQPQQGQSTQESLLLAQQALNNSSRRGSGLTGGNPAAAVASSGNDFTLDDIYKLMGASGNSNANNAAASFQDSSAAAAAQLQQQAAFGGLYNNPFAGLQGASVANNSFLLQQFPSSANQGFGATNNPDQDYQNLLLQTLNQKVLFAQQQQQGLMDQNQLLQLQQQQQQQAIHHPVASEPVKVEAPAPKTALPLRALSAYNFYFRDERERILNGGDPEYTEEKKQALLAGHWFRDRTVKRRHRKTHGKVSFTTLSKLISQRWRDLDADHKEFYRTIAQEDLDRYQRELGNLNGNGEDNKKETTTSTDPPVAPASPDSAKAA